MSAITEYVESLPAGPDRQTLEHMFEIVRQTVPNTKETIYYGMPGFKYMDRGLVSIMVTKKFLSLYPYSGLTGDNLTSRLNDYERTKGSIHFSAQQPIPDDLLRLILKTRKQEIEIAADAQK